MLKTFFGCCPLSNGVSVIAIVNLFINITQLMLNFQKRYMNYYYCTESENNDTTNSSLYQSNPMVCTGKPIMSEMFMDYIFALTTSWTVLQIILNISLKQSTFKRAPHKVYSWLIVYYSNLVFLSLHFINYVTLLKSDSIPNDQLYYREDINLPIFKLLFVLMVLLEIFVIHSFYILEKDAMLNTFVQLKWRYVHQGGKVISEGVDIAPTSTFMASTSHQTEENSRQPPYITNILQNQP